jgi:DNA-directed RNA polymerase subunit RPC12/RpoP
MPIIFRCQKCGAEIIISHLSPGETAQCKTCGARNIVPEGNPKTGSDSQGDHPKLQPVVTENKTKELTKLDSEKTAPVLLTFLWLTAAIQIVITLIMYNLLDYLGNPYQSGEYRFFIGLGLILIITLLGTIIFFSIWLYRVHEELAVFYPGYSVKPVSAVLRLLIPVFNIWGMWNIFMNLIRRFRNDEPRLRRLAQRLFIPFMTVFVLYVAGYISIVKYLIPDDRISYEGLFGRSDVVYSALSVIQSIFLIFMLDLIRQGLKHKFSGYRERTASTPTT